MNADEERILRQVDPGIRDLVGALRQVWIDTDWACQGTEGHLCIRPTVQAKTLCGSLAELDGERRRIEGVLARLGLKDYWLSLVWHAGSLDTHGGEPTWLIQLPGRFDFVAIPIALSARFQDEVLDRVPERRS